MSKSFPRVILAGTHSGVGKTTIAIGLVGALIKRSISVQPYKVGPDYIDAGFHSDISGRACRNLDSYFLSRDALLELFSRQAKEVSFSLIEGVMGLYDGLAENPGIGSTGHVAKILKTPVILIIDAGKIAASAGALALGYKRFDPKIDIAGCILNRVTSRWHYEMLKKSIEKNCRMKVVGYLPKDDSLLLAERHLGLKPAAEVKPARIYDKIRKAAEKYIDIDAVIAIGNKAPSLPRFKSVIFTDRPSKAGVFIAVARDRCFHFYYQDNLDILQYFGARLRFFSPLKSKRLPRGVSGLYIGGGFPEIFAEKLAANKTLLAELKTKSREGMPIYAECGGLMYLMKELRTQERSVFRMAGIFPGRTEMGKKLRMFGYYKVKTEYDTILGRRGALCKGHLFHWSYITGMPRAARRVFRLKKGKHLYRDGYVRKNTIASYLHLHFASKPGLAKNFVESCRGYKKDSEGRHFEHQEHMAAVILAHGSKVDTTKDTLRGVVKLLKKNLKLKYILPAYLQFCLPTLPEVTKRLVMKGCRKIIIVPYFLFNGNHVTRDIPSLIQKEKENFPGIELLYAKALSEDEEKMSDIIAQRIEEAV